MRTAFVESLTELARRDPRIWLLCGDLGFSVLEPFIDEFPERFVNAGVAEQNMAGVAAGLALSGKKVFIYSIANFPVMRCLEQIRNDICHHQCDVKIVSVGAGVTYGTLGYSHHGLEDIAVMRAMPGMTVVIPADPVESRLATRALAASKGPAYLRLGKAGDAVLHSEEPVFAIGRAITLRPGTDVCLIGCGSVVGLALQAADTLSRRGISARVLSMHTVKPLDSQAVAQSAAETPLIVTIEEHGIAGGLHSAVLEDLAAAAECGTPCLAVGIPQPFDATGSSGHLREMAGLTADGIVADVLRRLSGLRTARPWGPG
jgi:transketolase